MHDLTQVSKGEQRLALWSSTLAFTVCFAVWTIFSIIGIQIKKNLGLNETQFGLLIATPILTGSLVRLMLGVWTDQYGGRAVFAAVMMISAVATWLVTTASTYEGFLLAALGVGISGGGFAVGIAYVSRWYPKERQGTALGIFGMGNVGAAVTKFTAPWVMVAFGWEMVANIWAGGIFATGILFYLFTKDDPVLKSRRAVGKEAESLASMLAPLKEIRVWRFSLYYFFVFGGFVALALWLPRYYMGAYAMDIQTAGILGAAYSVPGSIFRAIGGWLSDKLGARRVMYWTFLIGAICLVVLCYPSTDYVIGQSGGGWGHYVGQEKLRPQTGWVPLAFATDWVRPSRQMNSTSYFYNHTDQWRHEKLSVKEILSPLANPEDFKGALIDFNVRSERMGWLRMHRRTLQRILSKHAPS
ncbi:membrane hypothetical protein [Candidatus Terasakiella magnetica]|nr:membrane hypothetical protein [Candidatus Terasakiella magnetica]